MQNLGNTSSAFIEALVRCAVLAKRVGELEMEYRSEYVAAVEYQRKIWLPRSKWILYLGGGFSVLGSFFGNNVIIWNNITLSFLTLPLGLSIAGLIWSILFIRLQFKGVHHKKFMHLERVISDIVKKEWIPSKKELDRLAMQTDIRAYQKEYENVSELDKAIRSLTRWKKAVEQMKTIDRAMIRSVMPIAEVMLKSMVKMAEGLTSMINDAGKHMGS